MLKKSRGVYTTDAILGIAILVVVTVSVFALISKQADRTTAKITATNIDQISTSVETYLFREYENVLQAANAAGGVTEIPINNIKDINAESDLFATHSPYKQPYKIFASYIDANTIDVLITTDQSSSNDVPIHIRGLIANYSNNGAGYIDNNNLISTQLIQDISKFQTANNIPNDGDVASYKVIRRNVLYGDVLYRKAIPGFTEANQMNTDLDMNGHNLSDVDTINTENLNVTEKATIRGNLDVFNDFNVVGSSNFEGNVKTKDIDSSGAITSTYIETGSASVSGTINTGSLTSNTLDTQSVVTTDLESTNTTGSVVNAGDTSADTINSDTVVSDQIITNRIRSNELNSSTAIFNDLTTGSCNGC